MAQPQPYNRQFNFADQQAQTPSAPLPGTQVDAELNAVKLTSDQTLANLARIQRDDGALRNGIVTQDSLSPSLSIGFTLRGEWAPGVNYLESDGVTANSKFYKATASHLSTNDNAPEDPGAPWLLLADFTELAADAAASAAAAQGSADAAAASASAAGNSAGAAALSADSAASSAGAASGSADAAAASAAAAAQSVIDAANVVGDGTGAVRWDVVQSLTTPQKLQTRQNVGITATGDAVVTADDLSELQTAVGVSEFIKGLLDDANAASAQTTLGGTTVGRAVFAAADATAGRAALSAQPISVGGNTIGSITAINTLAGNGFNLPSGGTWEYQASRFTSPGGAYAGTNFVDIAAGGTSIPGLSGYVLVGRAKRIA